MKKRRKRKSLYLYLFLSLFLVVSLSLILIISLFHSNRGPADGGAEGDAVAGKAASKKAAKPKEAPLPDTVTAAFYNVENLFDLNLDGTEYDEYKPGWFGWTEEVQRAKLEGAAEVIAALGADFVGLCEVENLNVLRELQAILDKMGAPYPYAAVAEAEKSATVTSLLSRFPIREKAAHPVPRSRSILEARVARGGDELIVFVNHWPSKRSPESKRVEAARVLKERLDALPPGSDYIIMGDLNSCHDEFASLRTAGLDDTKGRTGVNHVLGTVVEGPRAQSPARFVCRGEMSTCTDCHYNLWLDVEESGRRSYVYRGAPQTIDNIILPPALFDSAGYSYVDGSFEAFTWDGKLLRDGVPYRWQMVFRGKQKYHTGKGYSDHLPIRAKFARASVLRAGADAERADTCASVDSRLVRGDFAVTVDGWMSGDARFSVARDSRYARTGTHSLRVSGSHESENRTAARARFEAGSQKSLAMSVRGSGALSVRLRRQEGKWECYNAPDFAKSKTARYKPWKSGTWVDLKFPLPEAETAGADVEVELRAGKGEPFSVWIDRVRLE